MAVTQSESDVSHKAQRPRANTSFGVWRRNMPDPSSSIPTASPAAPMQTFPIDDLIKDLSPPSIPSIEHARSLIQALKTQSPTPKPELILPVLSILCNAKSSFELQAAGYDILTTYCKICGELPTSDWLSFFNIIDYSGHWFLDLWEPRIEALDALMINQKDMIGVEQRLFEIIKRWLGGAVGESISAYSSEVERAIEDLSDKLLGLIKRFEEGGRLSEDDLKSLLEFYGSLVDHVLITSPKTVISPIPPISSTPIRESHVLQHRRKSSAVTNISILSDITTHPPVSTPISTISNIYVKFLKSKFNNFPVSCLPLAIPLLFRILSSIMGPLPRISHKYEITNDAELKIIKIISKFLQGQDSSACLILLRYHLQPHLEVSHDIQLQIKTSLGAIRALRLQIRDVLGDRMAERLVQTELALNATHAGTPGVNDLESENFERAIRSWKRKGSTMWDARKISVLLTRAIGDWISVETSPAKEQLFEEIVLLLQDVSHELSTRQETDNRDPSDTDTGVAIGHTLVELTKFVKTLRTEDGRALPIPLSKPDTAPSRLLKGLAEILGDTGTAELINPPLPVILLGIIEHLSDTDSEKIPCMMAKQRQLRPSDTRWLDNWSLLLENSFTSNCARPLTSHATILALQSVFSLIRDMPVYRRPLMDKVFHFWTNTFATNTEGGDILWHILGEEVQLRVVEDESEGQGLNETHMPESCDANITKILLAMFTASTYCDCKVEPEIQQPSATVEPIPVSPSIPQPSPSVVSSTPGTPFLSRMISETALFNRERDSSGNNSQHRVPLLSFGTKHSSHLHTPILSSSDDNAVLGSPVELSSSPIPALEPSKAKLCRGLSAATALIDVFTSLSFDDSAASEQEVRLAIHVFGKLRQLLRTAKCPRARIAILQMLFRLRADRDHRVYLLRAPAEQEKQIVSLARQIGRTRESSRTSAVEDARMDEAAAERARTMQRNGRRLSRGRGSRTSGTGSRSRSRAAGRGFIGSITPVMVRPREQLWMIPDHVPFSLSSAGRESHRLVTYDPNGPNDSIVLPVSAYMDELVEMIKTGRDWEVLSYVLVHLPAQLANKHFWCGPLARASISNLLHSLCTGISAETLGKWIPQEEWPGTLKARDAVGLAYHTLTILISYQQIFDNKRRRELIEVLQEGLSGKGESVVICTHALILCAFEMEQTMIKMLPSILPKFAQIVTNPSMAVHILTFLCILNSLPAIHANFTPDDFRLVFHIALQYLQHHKRPETIEEIQFSLGQHVRIMCYSVLYMWFLTLKLEDRPQHVKYIVRQLLLANTDENSDSTEVDEPTEVCFDFLARYAYANADPKPAPSLLGEILSNPGDSSEPEVQKEKSWIVGYSIVTVKLLARPGWMEVTVRRASGTTKFLCRSENVPLVGLGDFNPDMVTIPAVLMMDKYKQALSSIYTQEEADQLQLPELFKSTTAEDTNATQLDPITGYVWSGTAPSQRRKKVDLDPSFFPVQLSPYPDAKYQQQAQILPTENVIASSIRSLDRTPVIDTHKVGVLYVGPGQDKEVDILRNTRGSPGYTRFLEGLGRLIKIRGQIDVYTGGLFPDIDGEYAYAWWDDTGQVLYHTATMMPNHEHDELCSQKKKHIGNDFVRIVWNDSGLAYRFDTLATQFQFVNIIIEPHSRGTIAAYSNNKHENEYYKLSVQCAEGMAEFSPIGDFKIVSARSLPIIVRQLSLVADWYANIFSDTDRDTERKEIITNWRQRLSVIKKIAEKVNSQSQSGVVNSQDDYGNFTSTY